MAHTSEVKPGERDPKRPPGLIVAAIAAAGLCTIMYVIFPGHGPIPGHAAAPAAKANPG